MKTKYKPLRDEDFSSLSNKPSEYDLTTRRQILSALRGIKEEIIKDKKECVKVLTNFDEHKDGDRAVAWICNKQYADMLVLLDKWFQIKDEKTN